MTRRLLDLLDTKEMVVVCGSGGTGKTTVAAALGVQAATRLGGRVLVLTVDPARRLADALGLAGALGNTPVRVDVPGAELWMAMLDTKAGWDELIRRHAPDPALRERVLANPLYRNITGRFVNSHDYIAMEQLHELHASGQYDLVIIDTPPSRNALDLLDAPGRMREFFGSALLKWLTVPYRSRLFNVATKPFNQIADRILGSRFLQDIAEFFVLFRTMEAGFVQRATEVERLLVDDRTTFVVVSTLDPAPAREARFLAEELRRRSMPLGAMVLNRTLPAEVRRTILEGGDGYDGVEGHFARLRRKSYKVHVRVHIARYRGYPPCPDCRGTRLGPEGRAWRVFGRTLPEVLALSVTAARGLFREEAVRDLLAHPNEELTPLRGNKLWQVTLVELWLQTHGA